MVFTNIGFFLGIVAGGLLAHYYRLPMFSSALTLLIFATLFSFISGHFDPDLHFTLAGISLGGLLFQRKAPEEKVGQPEAEAVEYREAEGKEKDSQ